MVTGILRRLHVSLVVVIALFVMTGGAYAEKPASSDGSTVLSGSAGLLSGFPAAGHGAIPFAIAGGSALLSRDPEGAFGSFEGESPQSLAVDGASGDVYVLDTNSGKLLRFTASGAPADFSAGPGATTNEISGLNLQHFPSFDQVAVDNSGGPSAGNVYVTESGSGDVRVFSSSGAELTTLKGEKTPAGGLGEDCGVAVDSDNGNVFVASWGNRIWRYSPSGASVEEKNYSGAIATSINPCGLAVAGGRVYAKDWKETPIGSGGVDEYKTTAFATGTPLLVAGTPVAGSATAVAADSASHDVYVDEGSRVSVLNAEGEPLYTFAGGEVGGKSTGVAVRPGGDAYVSDSASNDVHRFGPTLQAGTRAHLGSFAGQFAGESPQSLALDEATGDVYAIDSGDGRLARFTASGAPADFSAGPGADKNGISGLNLQHFPSFDQVAVDNSGGPSAGNVYVTESGSGDVRVFSSSGAEIATLTGSGTPAGSFGEDCGAAVDPSNGDVYVASWNNRIWRYTPTGATVTEADFSGGIATSPVNPCQLAVAGGHLYAKDWKESPTAGTGGVDEYETSAFSGAVPSVAGKQVAASATAIAADSASGDVYVDEGNQVAVLNAEGEPLYTFAGGEIGETSTGVAVRSGGDAYVSDSADVHDPSNAHAIHIFGPFSAPPPIVETKPASAVTHVKATLNGHLDPNNSLPITGCVFQIGPDTSYGEPAVPCAQGSTFTAPAGVSAQLSGLTPGSTFHYRLQITTATETFDGADQSFETPAASSTPELTTSKGTTVSDTSTRMEGSIDPDGNPLTGCHFEYVTDTAFQSTGFEDLSSGASVPCDQEPASLGEDFEDHPVTATATGLDPNQDYRYRLVATNANGTSASQPVLLPGPPIVETTGSPTRTATTARLDSRVIPHGQSTSYWFEYTTDSDYKANGFTNAKTTPHTSAVVNDAQLLLVACEEGRYRLRYGSETTTELDCRADPAEIQAALSALPAIGTGNITVVPSIPRRSDKGERDVAVTFVDRLANTEVPTLAIVNGSVPLSDGLGRETIGSCSVETLEAGGVTDQALLVSASLEGLAAATSYDYRLVADNGTPGPPSAGQAVSLATRDSDTPLSHGNLPGPPESDRAWEQVSIPDTDGNNARASSISDNGERVLYDISGGSPGSGYGGETLASSNYQFAERTPSGWVPRPLFPQRSEAPGNAWQAPVGASDLHELYAFNWDETHSLHSSAWRLTPGAPAQQLDSAAFANGIGTPAGIPAFRVASEDGSRLVGTLGGPSDPENPVPAGIEDVYDLSGDTPKLISLLPGNVPPPCGVYPHGAYTDKLGVTPVGQQQLTPDGSHYFFIASPVVGNCEELSVAPTSLYDRDLLDSTTTLIAPGGVFIRYAAGSVYFVSQASLGSDDPPGTDIYRYQVHDHSVSCLTCSIPGGAHVSFEFNFQAGGFEQVAVAADGSRLYFRSERRLLPGSAAKGIYRLNLAGGELAYVAPGPASNSSEGAESNTADNSNLGSALSPDGSVFVFSSASPLLDATAGPQNGGVTQYYRYDDRNRSLVCLSCSPGGAPPRADVPSEIVERAEAAGANLAPVSSAGDVVFSTPTPLVRADQNTAPEGEAASTGTDIYEWRDGRLLLVTDGRTSSQQVPGTEGLAAGGGPQPAGVSASGRDVFFTQPTRLTPDTIDSSDHLFDARIGGGFVFPAAKQPCALEACQPSASASEARPSPGSSSWVGPGNQAGQQVAAAPGKTVLKRCAKGNVRRRGRCVRKPASKRCAKGKVHRKGRCVRAGKPARRANRNHRGVK